MSERAEGLAQEFEQVVGQLLVIAERCSPAQWRTVCAAEGQSVGGAVYHVARWFPAELERIERLATGGELPYLDAAMIDRENARHADRDAACTREEATALLRRNAATVAAAIRSLGDAQLDRVGQYLEGGTVGPVEVLVERVLIAHPREHPASIRATLGE